jgi:hypothetical protein
MIELPRAAPDTTVADVIEEARRLAGRDLPLVHVIQMTEGRAAQILHVGPADEMLAVRKLYRLVAEAGLRPAGDLHQFLLSDPEMVPRERSRSMLRVPVEPLR